MNRVKTDRFSEKEATPIQQRWAEEYLIDMNATQAALRAGYSPKGAHVSGYENMRRPHVMQLVILLMAARAKRTETTQDRVLLEVKRLALSSIRDVCEWDETGKVTVKSSDEIPPDAAAAISEIQATRTTDLTGTVTDRLKIKLHAKFEPVKLLGQHVGLFTDKHEHLIKGVVQHEHRKAMERSIKDLSLDEVFRIRAAINQMLPVEVQGSHVEPEQLTRTS